ncbi:MAG: DUF58 domain-containing protein [Colwellia sp.]|nr:DUF58 domain-containing protein [Colwellia sp.]
MTNKNRWQVKLTGYGATWLTSCLVILILATNYSNNLLLFIALILLVLLINSSWLSWLNIRQFSIKTLQLAPIYADQNGVIKAQIMNPKAKKTLALTITAPLLKSSSALPLTQDKLFTAIIKVHHLPRGCFTIETLQLSTTYPLSLWCWRKNFTNQATLWVYPAPKGKQPLPKPKAKQGTYLKREQGDFSHVRTYQRGDSLNHIAWKQMARTGEVMTKEFDGGEGLRQTVLCYQDLKTPDTEARLSQLCRWILDCHQKQLKYALDLPNKTIAAGQGEAHKENCLQALAQFGITLNER